MSKSKSLSLAQFPLRVVKAAVHFVRRQDRTENPAGKFDKGGRWYPTGAEAKSFDYSVRSPSRAWPYSYLLHARTAKQVAALYGVPEAEVKKAARAIRKLQK